jgi:hypothetical protein
MQAVALLKQTPHPTDADIDTTMYGNMRPVRGVVVSRGSIGVFDPASWFSLRVDREWRYRPLASGGQA